MKKNILLVEPAFKSKYPPLGLMKIATYHKNKKDSVVFVRGCNKNLRDNNWDRIYISTLFTYTWDITVKTINFYRDTLFSMPDKIFVGGILATLMPRELYNATGVRPVSGLLTTSEKIGLKDKVNIDELPPDYSILKQVENETFQYVYTNAYIGYSSRGCKRTCDFCAVKTLEPEFINYVDIKKMVTSVKRVSGEKQDLLLMDNNVLASDRFDDIIDDIKKMGFVKGAKDTKTKRRRTVDFNQGLDARFLTEEKMKRLAEISLEPMRIAFDDVRYKKIYVNAVRLAQRYQQKYMSNYILYNFKDTPEDFYERLKINIDLNEEFAKLDSPVRTVIYSFPMRYLPLDAKARNVDTGNTMWTPLYLRGLQLILNVIKGPVMPGFNFFEQAFGRNAKEFIAYISMPEEFIRLRVLPNWRKIKNYEDRLKPYVRQWLDAFNSLTEEEYTSFMGVMCNGTRAMIQDSVNGITNKKVSLLLKCHTDTERIVKRGRI